MKRTLLNPLHARRDRQRCQLSAIVEGVSSNARHPLGEGDRLQFAAPRKGTSLKKLHIRGDYDLCQRRTRKRRVTNDRHALRDCNRLKTLSIVERLMPDLCHA